MELGSEHSDDDKHAASVLISMTNSRIARTSLEPSRQVQTKEEDSEFENQESMASDEEEKEPAKDLSQEQTYQNEEPFGDTLILEKEYSMPFFSKASGEEILQLTSLYQPVPKTQAYYDKINQIERVCKSATSHNEYQVYTRNHREYQAQLSDFFASSLSRDNSLPIVDDLMQAKKDYNKKILIKRLKALDFKINTLEIYTPSLDAPFSVSEKEFYDIKNSDFTEKIIWKNYQKKTEKPASRKIIKGQEEYRNTEQILYVNYNEKEVSDLKKIFSFEPNDFGGRVDASNFSKFPALSSKISKISFEFSKRQGKPGKYEIKQMRDNEVDIWGGLIGEKRERSDSTFFTVKKRKHLFTEELQHMLNEAPTNINQYYKEPFWKDLVFNRDIHKLKERYGKLVVNPLDPNNLKVKEPEASESSSGSDDMDQYDDEFESKVDKSVFSDSSILGAKHAEQSMRSKVTMLKHAAPAYDYPFFKTEWTKQELRNFHRPDVYLRGKKWKVKLTNQYQAESRGEVVTSHSMFNSAKQLSLKEGGFLLLEYLEKRPPLLNNFGMASKIRRYYLGARRAPEEYPKYVGKLGLAEYIDSNKQFPLIGNLLANSALAVMESNLFRVPLYCQSSKHTDFLMIKYQKQNGKFIWYLRYIDNLYTTGQIEPKLEVMAPNARNTNAFHQKRIQAFIYNTLLANNNKIDLREVSQNFTSINESAIRKQMKHINCEQQPDGSWVCNKLPSLPEVKEMITPEEICQYESMLAGQRRLKDKGVKITSIDKVPNAIQKLKKEMDNKEINYLADFIEEELTITPWNLTSSYLKTKGEKGMMRITGIGDPTHGNCGFSFVRLPMKLPNLEKPITKNDPSDYLPTNMAVTGTNADLRTLTKDDVRKLLLKMGYRKEEVQGIGRWSGVAMLRNKASKLVSEGYKGGVEKYARGIRMSTKMQKEQCQKTIDEIFMKQVKMLGDKREYNSDKGSDSEDDYLTKQVAENINKVIEEKPSRLEWDEDNEISEKKRLEEFKNATNNFAAVPAYQAKTGMKKVLKRVVKMRNLQGSITVKVNYITDPEEIEEFYKKKAEEEQPKIKEKNEKAMEAIKEKVLKINDLKRKKKKDLDVDLKKDEKRFEDKKPQEKNNSELASLYLTQANSSELPTSGAGKIICGKCGMAGHMKTNRKKCPMYAAESPENFRAEKEGMVKMEGSKIKLSIDKIQQAAEKKKEEHFYGDYSRPKTISARRRRQIEENPYEDIAFKLIRFDDTKLFINPVKKETYPDYYNYIQTPMDLTAMNAKAKRGGYISAQSFIEDLDLIVYNSTLYNGATHDVTHQSITIQQEGLRLLKEKELLIDLPEYSND